MSVYTSILRKQIRSFIPYALLIGTIAHPLMCHGATFALKSKVYAGTYSGFAERLTITAGDIDGDGDPDIIGGFAQGGLVYLRNPETHLSIAPPGTTLLTGESVEFSVLDHDGPVMWSLVRNSSGGMIGTSDGMYTAGSVPGSFDIIEARSDDGIFGRVYVNVIDPDDVSLAGKAIVVSGGKSLSDPVWPTSDYLADLAYNTLRYCGFSRDNLEYLSFGPDNDVDGNGSLDDIDGFSSLAAVSNAINSWATDAERLFIYLTDHGGDSAGAGYFRLNGSEVLTAVQLDTWLDTLQDTEGMDVTVVIDCCYAGSFIDELTYDGAARRIVVASCGDTELTYFLAGGLVSFSDVFFHALMQGFDLDVAFGLGADAMSAYQTARLDDGGSSVEGTTVGASFIVGRDYPTVGQVSENQTLDGETHALVWAGQISSAYPIQRVWCAIVGPGHQPNTNASLPVIDVPEVDLVYNASLQRYEADIDGFAEIGTYQINFYAEDVWGGASYPRQSFVTQAGYDERMIIVTGGTTNDAMWETAVNMAGMAYRTALARRLDKANIQYISAITNKDLDGDGSNDVSALSTLDAMGQSITNWAAGADKLTVYLIGSSMTNVHYRMNAAEALTATQLDAWLDSVQVSNCNVIVVMDFDGCGSYIPLLSAPAERERIVIASARESSTSVRAAGGLISFSQFFLSGIFDGQNLRDAFNDARLAIRFASGQLKQTSQLDDNGNGIPDEKNLDGLIAVERYLGAAFVTGEDSPFIGSAMPPQVVAEKTPVSLWAADIINGVGISNVWCVITPPDYTGQGDLPQVDLLWNTGNNRYEGVYTNFTVPGTYACTFYARGNDDLLSSPVQSEVTVTDVYEVDDTPAQASIFTVGELQPHNFHSSEDLDWVKFYAPTDLVFNIDATQQGTNIDLRLDLYYEQLDGSLESIDSMDYFGTGSGELESLSLDLKANPFGLSAGMYFVQVSSANTNAFGPDSDYDLQIYIPAGVSGGVIELLPIPGPLFAMSGFYVFLGPPEAVEAGAGWRVVQLTNQTYYSDTATYGLPVNKTAPTLYNLTFASVPGFQAPADQAMPLIADDVTSVIAYYIYTNLSPKAVSTTVGTGDVFNITYLGYAGENYVIDGSTNLIDGGWVPLWTNQVPQDGWLRFSTTNTADQAQGFYRARLIE